jgi:hypothetical protein
MTYLAQGAMEYTPSKTPTGAPDISRIWVEMKGTLREKLGIYRMPDGSPALIANQAYPLLTINGAGALQAAWVAFGDKVIEALQKAGRPTASVLKAQNRFLGDYREWMLGVIDKYGGQTFQGKYLFAPAVRDLFAAISRYTLELATAQWAGFNIENAYERMIEVLDDTPGGSLIKWPFEQAYAVADWISKGGIGVPPLIPDLGPLVRLIKWGSILGGLGMLYWYVLRPKS